MSSIDEQHPVAQRSGEPATRPAPSQNLLWWLTLGYSAFVIYGSLVPLHFQRRPLSEAVEYFRRIP